MNSAAGSSSVRLRPWPHAALARFVSHDQPDFLAVATPGAGKTTFALVAARIVLAEQPAPVVVITPTAHLKTQWAQAAARLHLHLDPAWSAADGGLPSDMHGVVIASDQEHARDIARLLSWEFRVTATVVTSDDPTASECIASFAAGGSEWLIAVRMVSEGVDIPRLRVRSEERRAGKECRSRWS